jgi:hypothetical protein
MIPVKGMVAQGPLLSKNIFLYLSSPLCEHCYSANFRFLLSVQSKYIRF